MYNILKTLFGVFFIAKGTFINNIPMCFNVTINKDFMFSV